MCSAKPTTAITVQATLNASSVRNSATRCSGVGVSVNFYQQKAELPGIKAAMPEYADVNSPVLQDEV
jgi:hypothetical protein